MNLKNVLFDLLRPFGITNNYTGCSQLIRAIQIVLEKPDGIQAVHKQIYAVIAKEYDLQPRSVESNIRTLSDIAWKNDPARLVQIAGIPTGQSPVCCAVHRDLFQLHTEKLPGRKNLHLTCITKIV